MHKLPSPISIIIPTLNEVGSAQQLMRRIDAAMHVAGCGYEVIVVDDHSSDGTASAYKALRRAYPIKFILKKGTRGKAQSLLQGFSAAQYDTIAMIDADLQYPPEALVDMINVLVDQDADIVLSRRLVNETNLVRRIGSAGFRFVFARLLFGLSYDTQSGLKVFKKAVLANMQLNPAPWSFDLEFIVRAREIEARIVEQNIIFGAREHDEAKINFLGAAVQLAKASLSLKFALMMEHSFAKEYQL